MIGSLPPVDSSHVQSEEPFDIGDMAAEPHPDRPPGGASMSVSRAARNQTPDPYRAPAMVDAPTPVVRSSEGLEDRSWPRNADYTRA